MTAQLSIEVVFAIAGRQSLLQMKVDEGTTARAALMRSALPREFPDIDFLSCPVGIWGKPVSDSHLLQAGDRLEAYRPLLHDPRAYRRELAARGRSMGTSNSALEGSGGSSDQRAPKRR